jgi:hypothetical protein
MKRLDKKTRKTKKNQKTHKNIYKKRRSFRKMKTMKGAAPPPPSFENKFREIQQAATGDIIQIPIRLYYESVKLTSDNEHEQINETLIFKDFLKDAETMTPSQYTAGVEDLFSWQRDNLTQGGICRLHYDDNDTGINLLLQNKPTVGELYSDNANMDEGSEDAMEIVYIFRKMP